MTTSPQSDYTGQLRNRLPEIADLLGVSDEAIEELNLVTLNALNDVSATILNNPEVLTAETVRIILDEAAYDDTLTISNLFNLQARLASRVSETPGLVLRSDAPDPAEPQA